MEKTGLKKHQLDNANRVRRAINYVAMIKHKSLENEETRAALHEMFLGMREAQHYIFFKRFLSGEDRTTYKQLAKETKLIELCKNDEVCMRNFTRGTLKINRSKGYMPQVEEVFDDVVYVKIEFLDYMYRDALAKFKKLVVENSLFAGDFEGWLNDWIYEKMENL